VGGESAERSGGGKVEEADGGVGRGGEELGPGSGREFCGVDGSAGARVSTAEKKGIKKRGRTACEPELFAKWHDC
jgi:hypothetical protein